MPSGQSKQIVSVGRRKTSIARVFLSEGKGNIIVNGKPLSDYSDMFCMIIEEPLQLVKSTSQFDLKITVEGGGLSGQAGAIRMGIARALVGFDESYRKLLRAANCLTRDARQVERKKFAHRKARKKRQFSKR
jgi:small subunit ribosomal protein S9